MRYASAQVCGPHVRAGTGFGVLSAMVIAMMVRKVAATRWYLHAYLIGFLSLVPSSLYSAAASRQSEPINPEVSRFYNGMLRLLARPEFRFPGCVADAGRMVWC